MSKTGGGAKEELTLTKKISPYLTRSPPEATGATMPPASIACIMSAADPEKFIRFVLLLLESKGASILKLWARRRACL